MRRAGAKEVHLRIGAPPVIASCYYGIDMPADENLIFHHRTLEEVSDFIGADSIGFLSVPGMMAAIGQEKEHLCWSCFSGEYPAGRP